MIGYLAYSPGYYPVQRSYFLSVQPWRVMYRTCNRKYSERGIFNPPITGPLLS
jgi:hypothetical protein